MPFVPREQSPTPLSPMASNNTPSNQCSLCSDSSTADMISCTRCQKSYHQSCAKVEQPTPHTWFCSMCSTAQEFTSPKSVKSTSSKASQSRRAALELQLLEEERQLSIARDKEFLNKKMQILQRSVDESDDEQSVTNISIRHWLNDAEQLNNPPVTSGAIISATQQIENSNTTTATSPNAQATCTTACTFSNFVHKAPIVTSNVPSTLNTTVGFNPATNSVAFINRLNPLHESRSTALPRNLPRTTVSGSSFNNTQPHLAFAEPRPHFAPTHSTITGINNTQPSHLLNSTLSSEQMFARHSVPKELPTFSGNAEEWPLFSATFDWSTQICGLTDAENLIRLQRALKGEALKSVQHILVHPTCVPTVLSTLQFLYGQPERILASIKNRIKATPQINSNRLESISNFAVTVKGLLATIQSCNLNDEITNSYLLQELVEKLPPNMQLTWGSQKLHMLKENKRANLIDFSNWIFEIGMSASVTLQNSDSNFISKYKTQKAHVNAPNMQHKDKCPICNSSCKHATQCTKFLNSDRTTKWNLVRRINLCKRCLKIQAKNKVCECKENCKISECQLKHHKLLHNNKINGNPTYDQITKEREEQNKTADKQMLNSETHLYNHNNQSEKVLFKIIPISVFGKNKCIKTFAFIDEGSSVSLLDESMAKELEIDGTPHPLCLKWTGQMQRRESDSKTFNLLISGSNEKQFSIKVHTVRQLSLPSQTIKYEKLRKQYSHLNNLPIDDYENATPRLLIGANHWNSGIPLEIKESSPAAPVAVRTRLGWLIYGNLGCSSKRREFFSFHICECDSSNSVLNELVKQFFSLESLGVKSPLKAVMGKDEERSLHLLNKFTQQRPDGHYSTGLLWRYDDIDLPESRSMAKRRLVCLEKKLSREPELFNVFQKTIDDYLSKGYISKLSDADINNSKFAGRIWYLPTFAVFNKNKPGKVRIVWDAAAKANGLSLNCVLLKGPDLLSSLPAILFRFRQKSVALSGDIQEMFHQIHIREEDKHAQRFLWRGHDTEKEPDVYVMNVMIFGAACAPSISQYIKNFNASKFKNEYPEAAVAIIRDHYVDDFLSSVDTAEEATQLALNIKNIHQQGGFRIRNWCSNNTKVVCALDDTAKFAEKNLVTNTEDKIEKVLGVFWVQADDQITFKISTRLSESDTFVGNRIPTKRDVLRLVMSIYDPLGLIGHIIMFAKILLQEIWRSHVDWDEQIRPAELIKWHKWLQILPGLRNIRIPRCYLNTFLTYENIDVQLHTFVDASENGYAAVCYFRLCDGKNIRCSLIGSKTRVAPLKITSIPRLELMAALIGSRYAKLVIEEHTIKINRRLFWSDSKTVLSWLKSDHRKYHQFVAFRVSEILDLTELSEWKYIPSKTNVADDATKWAKKPDFSQQSRWFCGPSFLYLPDCEWPKESKSVESTTEELKQHVLVISKNEPIFDVSRFSKWTRLLRCAAYVLRFMHRCKNKLKAHSTIELSSDELRAAENILYREAQREYYAGSITILSHGKKLVKSDDLYKLTPFLDTNNLLRIDSRLGSEHAPIIMPRKSAICKLIIKHYHEHLRHMNHETDINELRQTFFISRLRATFKSVANNCQLCKVRKASPTYPLMAKLPEARTAVSVLPFTFTGVDYFGPISVVVNRHNEKRYGAPFTCLTIRAVHIEIVTSLNTSSCIMATRNFMARCGTPREFFSDNATNFVGSERELREAYNNVDKDAIIREFTTSLTKWNFITPKAPHMGGAWERLIRSIKTILYSILPTRNPTEELLRSMMAEVENIINSRPLTYVPLDYENSDVLTPNHLLLGSSNGMKPLAIYDDDAVVLQSSWLRSQQFAERFWRKWVAEYLPNLTCRTKWHKEAKPVREGDLVIVVDSTLPRNVWLRGKVVEVKLATDGQVRSATVLTSHGLLVRPATKLAVLDVAAVKE